MHDHGRPRILSRRVLGGIPVALVVSAILFGCVGGGAGAGIVLFVSGRQSSRPTSLAPQFTVTSTAGATKTAMPTATRTAVSGGRGPTATPVSPFPPATPQPPLYSVSVVSKVFGVNYKLVGMNVQTWPPAHDTTLRVTYSICAAGGTQIAALAPAWSDYGVGEAYLDATKCWQQGSTIQFSITAYWTTGQTGQMSATLPITW